MATLNIEIDVPIPVGNTLYVDAVYGNNTTATPDRFDLPYLTLNAAKAAWLTGDEIIVRPGTYNERLMFGPCNWHFELGAVGDYTGVGTGNAFGDDFDNPATGKVTGWGVFRHSGTPDNENPIDGAGYYNGAVGWINPDTDVYFECLNVEGRQGANLGAGGICFDSGIINLNIKGELSSTIYDAFLAGAEHEGNAVVRGFINRVYTSIAADNAIESTANDIDVTIGEVVHGNTDVMSFNVQSGAPIFRVGKISGGGVRLENGKIIGANISLQDTSDDADGETLKLGVAASLVDCQVTQTKAGVAVVTAVNGADLTRCKIIAGAGATESIRSNGVVTITSRGSTVSVPVGGSVTVEGELFYDDGTDPSGKVATGNTDGTWSWAAPSAGDVSTVAGRTGDVVITASDLADFDTEALAAAPAETTTTTGALINGATEKTTPVDADFVGLMDSAASNVLKKLSWANIKATLKAYFDTLYAPLSTASFLTYTGGSQAYAVTTLAAINSTTFTFPSTGLYHVQYAVTHDANATTTGGNFGVAGTAVFDYLNWTVVYRVDAATAGRSVMTQVSFLSTGGVGLPAQSSANTTNNRVSVDIWINVTTVGNVSLLAASEVAVASGITVTDVTGFMKKEG